MLPVITFKMLLCYVPGFNHYSDSHSCRFYRVTFLTSTTTLTVIVVVFIGFPKAESEKKRLIKSIIYFVFPVRQQKQSTIISAACLTGNEKNWCYPVLSGMDGGTNHQNATASTGPGQCRHYKAFDCICSRGRITLEPSYRLEYVRR